MELIRSLLFLSVLTVAFCSESSHNKVKLIESSSTEQSSTQNDAVENTTLPIGFPFTSFIVGGVKTTIEKVPWQVALRYNSEFSCGGVIIAPEWILTAAHCTPRKSGRGYSIRVGSSNREHGGSIFQIQRFYRHHKYRTSSSDYDYSLGKLTQSMEFSASIQPIALPATHQHIPGGTVCYVSGWGEIRNLNETQDELRVAKIPIVSQNRCQREYDEYEIPLTSRMICAGSSKSGIDACFGDSGGPLACTVNGSFLLAGLVSFGADDECGKTAGVYSKISTIREWIYEKSDI